MPRNRAIGDDVEEAKALSLLTGIRAEWHGAKGMDSK